MTVPTASPTSLVDEQSKNNSGSSSDESEEHFGLYMIIVGCICFAIFSVLFAGFYHKFKSTKKPLICGDIVVHEGMKGVIKGFDLQSAKFQVLMLSTGRTNYLKERNLIRLEEFEAAAQKAFEELEKAEARNQRLLDQKGQQKRGKEHHHHHHNHHHKQHNAAESSAEPKGVAQEGKSYSEPKKSHKNLNDLKEGFSEPKKTHKNLKDMNVAEPKRNSRNLNVLKESRGVPEPRKSHKNLNELKESRGVSEPKKSYKNLNELKESRGVSEPRKSHKNLNELKESRGVSEPRKSQMYDINGHKIQQTTKQSPSRLSPKRSQSTGSQSPKRPQILKTILDSEDSHTEIANALGISLTTLRTGSLADGTKHASSNQNVKEQKSGLHKRRLMLGLGNLPSENTASYSPTSPDDLALLNPSSNSTSPPRSPLKMNTTLPTNKTKVKKNFDRPSSRYSNRQDHSNSSPKPSSSSNNRSNSRYLIETNQSGETKETHSWLNEEETESIFAAPLGSAI